MFDPEKMESLRQKYSQWQNTQLKESLETLPERRRFLHHHFFGAGREALYPAGSRRHGLPV